MRVYFWLRVATPSRGQVKGVPFQLIQRQKMLVLGSTHILENPLLSYRSGVITASSIKMLELTGIGYADQK